MTTEEKFDYLKKNIYEHIKHSHTGRLIINTRYCRLAAKILGGDYDSLSKIQKDIFKGDLVFENLNPYLPFDKYLKY